MVLRLADSVKRKPSILEEKSDKSRGFGGGAPILRMICFLGPEGEQLCRRALAESLPPWPSRCPRHYRRFDLAAPQQLRSGGGHLPRPLGVAHLQRDFVQARKAQVRLQVLLRFRQGLPFLVRRRVVVLLVLPPPFPSRIQAHRRESARPMKVQVRVQVRCIELLHGLGMVCRDVPIAYGPPVG